MEESWICIGVKDGLLLEFGFLGPFVVLLDILADFVRAVRREASF